MNDNVKLTAAQIRKMKHAIGFTPAKAKKGSYKAYRNYYVSWNDDADWDGIVAAGLAIKRKDIFYELNVVYHLNAKGIELLSEITDIKITEAE
ncbi:hypothetical protein EEK90_02975 [Muribaculaceae bacterium Isolate-036 (Harlan)]|nr:hypothetical protein EEK90_02975 [Muribaculaceae bacterium Isolate-036 (Harlan)]